MIIGVSGYAQAGKDTFADILVAHYGFKKISFADKLRECLAALNPVVDVEGKYSRPPHLMRYNEAIAHYGYPVAKSLFPEIRVLLQRFGTEVGRDLLGNDVWVEAFLESINYDLNQNIVIPDVRFKNEAEMITYYRGHVVRVVRPDVFRINDHPSEDQDFKVDTIIHNDGNIDDLVTTTHTFMAEIKPTLVTY